MIKRKRTSCQETTEARLEYEEPTSADIKACQKTNAGHEQTEVDTDKIEPDSGMMQSIGAHQEIPKGEAAVMPVGGLRKRRRVKKLPAEHRRSRRKGHGDIVDGGKEWPLPAEG
jgi:hypothetical protein